jgi:hypothetical protein
MTSFIAAGGSGRPTSVIPAVPAASSVTTIAFIRDLPVEWLAQYLARRRTMDMGLDDRPKLDRRAAETIIAWNSRDRR